MRTYYNEFEPCAAAWLRELMRDGLIPTGEVDERSISEVSASDLRGYDQCHFFAGIGGWPYALQLAGWTGPCWTGSCPCQPFSCAGKGLGTQDARHLWPVFRDLIRDCKPPIVFGEQVASSAGREWLAGVFADLERMGYCRAGADLCASCVGAPHIRQRLYWVALAGQQQARGSLHGPAESHGANGSRASGEFGGSGGIERVAIAECPERRPQQSADERNGSNAGRYEATSWTGACCEVQRLEYPTGNERGKRRTEPSGRCVASGCGDGWAGNTTGDNEQGQRQSGESDGRPGEVGGSGNGSCGVGESNGSGSQPGNEAAARVGHGDSVEPTGFWTDSTWHQCRDGKARRIPAESVLLGVADGVPESLDVGRASSGFPLSKKIKGQATILRGYGNAIVPELAAEFIRAVMDVI